MTGARGTRGTRKSGSRYAELKAEVERIKMAAKAAGQELEALGAERADEPRPVRRKREALRRRRAGHLLELDKLLGRLKASTTTKRRVATGPKWGVRSVVQGGSPGSGKRA